VLGRCLLALCDEGRLLVFRAYQHDPALGLAGLARDFAERLAAAMNTRIAGGGRVPALVAPEWYDDGARDLYGRLEALRERSFAEELASIGPRTFEEKLLDLFASEPASDVIDALTEGDRLAGRPDLVRVLARLVAACPSLAFSTQLDVARLAAKAAAPDDARQIARRLAAGPVRRHHPGVQPDLPILLAELGEPQLALRVLRSSRHTRVRGWEDETEAWRLHAAALAHERLHRLQRAADLYTRAGDHEAALRVTALARGGKLHGKRRAAQ